MTHCVPLFVLRPAAATLCAWALATAVAAPPAEMQSALQAAVQDYEAGHLGKAHAAFEQLSRAGLAAADHNLAVMHLRGELPGASTQEALRLMTRAAQRGFVTAMFELGRLHESGQLGRIDLAAAHRWYAQAAEAGSTAGQVETATAFYLGRGAPRDAAQAAHWYRAAAVGGDNGAQYLLASMYESGDGLPQDLRLARYWYAAAAAGGDPAAALKARALAQRLETDPDAPASPGVTAPP